MVAVAEAAFNSDGFERALSFNDESFGAFNAHPSDLLGDAFCGVPFETAF